MRFETGILLGNPGAVRLFKLCFALPRCLALRSRLQRFKLLGGHDDGVNAPIFFNVDRLCFGLGADGAKPVLGLGGGNSHGMAPTMDRWPF